MTTRPILFSGPMVRAIDEGRKTQTRRIIKPQPYPWKMEIHRGELFVLDGGWRPFCKIPYGCPGDRLWVRETWTKTPSGSIWYRADGHSVADGSWKPSIHMPRWASRITLEITDVRVQRLQDISEEDAIAEGVTLGEDRSWAHREAGIEYKPHVIAFSSLWQSINGPGSWDLNPWVWAITFRRVET